MNNYYSPYALPTYAMPGYPAPLISNDIPLGLPVMPSSGATPAPQTQSQINMGLRQLKDFQMMDAFQDSDGKVWKLVKSANDSSVEIPDPQYVQITDYWSHEFPNSNGKIYIYVIEGIKRPRVDNEKSVNVLYQWFSTANNPNWNPNMISQSEWHRANVYTSAMTSSRVSKLKALCRFNEIETKKDDDIDLKVSHG